MKNLCSNFSRSIDLVYETKYSGVVGLLNSSIKTSDVILLKHSCLPFNTCSEALKCKYVCNSCMGARRGGARRGTCAPPPPLEIQKYRGPSRIT